MSPTTRGSAWGRWHLTVFSGAIVFPPAKTAIVDPTTAAQRQVRVKDCTPAEVVVVFADQPHQGFGRWGVDSIQRLFE